MPCDVGNLFQRALVEVVKLQQHLVFGRQSLYSLVQLFGSRGRRQLVGIVLTHIKRQHGLSFSSPQMVHRLVVGYALQPCRESCSLRVIVPSVLVGGNKRVLHHVFGILLLHDDTPHECHERGTMAFHQQAKALVAAVSHELYELLFIVRHSIYI